MVEAFFIGSELGGVQVDATIHAEASPLCGVHSVEGLHCSVCEDVSGGRCTNVQLHIHRDCVAAWERQGLAIDVDGCGCVPLGG